MGWSWPFESRSKIVSNDEAIANAVSTVVFGTLTVVAIRSVIRARSETPRDGWTAFRNVSLLVACIVPLGLAERLSAWAVVVWTLALFGGQFGSIVGAIGAGSVAVVEAIRRSALLAQPSAPSAALIRGHPVGCQAWGRR